jgi:hypothetical protein
MCHSTGPRADELTAERRANNNCALPGVDRSKWQSSGLHQIHLKAPARHELKGKAPDWHHPWEDIRHEGCPGAWYRTAFVASLLPYRRRPDSNGGRVSNPALDRCDDPLVHEAIDYMESHEDWAHADTVRAMTPKT